MEPGEGLVTWKRSRREGVGGMNIEKSFSLVQIHLQPGRF
jgi:hypothetical protein